VEDGFWKENRERRGWGKKGLTALRNGASRHKD